MTNREAYEQAAGMELDNLFFEFNMIDPEAEYDGEDGDINGLLLK